MKDHFLDIEAYLDGSMTEAERNDFETALRQHADLRRSLEEYQQLRNDLAWHYASNDVAKAAELRRELQKRRRIRLFFLVALLAFTLAGFFIWKNAHAVQDNPAPAIPPVSKPNSPEIIAPQEQTPSPKSAPIAGNIKRHEESGGDLYRDLPKEDISVEYGDFFKQQMKGFAPVVEAKGQWAPLVVALAQDQPARAQKLLKQLPKTLSNNDTTRYLQSLCALQLGSPSVAETTLYTLSADKKWQTEAQYLLAWVYLLRGESDLSKSALKSLPEDYRDKKAMNAFLNR